MAYHSEHTCYCDNYNPKYRQDWLLKQQNVNQYIQKEYKYNIYKYYLQNIYGFLIV